MATRTRLQAAAELLGKGRLAEARARLLKELRLAPRSAPAVELLGAVAFEMGRHDEAIDHLRLAVRLAPNTPGPRLNLGKALLETGRADEAAELLQDAVRRWPHIPEGRFSLGNALFSLAKPEQAVQEFDAAIRLAPTVAGPYFNLAVALYGLDRHEAVCDVCEQLLRLDPQAEAVHLLLAMSRQVLCVWEDHEARRAKAAEVVRRGHAVYGMALASMTLWDDAGLHLRCAGLAKELYVPRGGVPASQRLAVRRSGRTRVAYVSADYRRHPMARLTAPLIEGHDRDRFEIVGISLGKPDDSPERDRLLKAFDRLEDVRGSSTAALVQAMREMEIDIAVDLMGYTRDARPDAFIQRVAPVQVSFLGYPGTSGIEAMDYLVVDPYIAAGELPQAMTEKLVILPDCYQPNEAPGQMPADRPSRSDCGLPEGAFVFCSFNKAKKLTPDVFDLWMRILRRVEGSVLWLMRPADAVAAALCREAEQRGVEPRRIVFADRVPNEAHIARNGVPDLHLDTFPYNAHTTASDALRAGGPILTRSGAGFPARVCGSLLTTVGVPELIAHSAEEYEALAVRLAHDKALLSGLRRRIEEGRARSPLFDPARFCRNIERAYGAMVELSRAGRPPEAIDVRALKR
jgi:predicted O-linked N-acetylglucosamine transferase (SPINDLY family)